jgi:hypothetical protein
MQEKILQITDPLLLSGGIHELVTAQIVVDIPRPPDYLQRARESEREIVRV